MPVQVRAQDDSREDRLGEPVSPSAASHAVGVLTVPAGQGGVGRGLLEIVARLLAWCEPEPHPAWGDLVGALGSRQDGAPDRAWTIVVSDEAGFSPEPRGSVQSPLARAIAFDLSLDCNTLRQVSPQPFSRTSRGHALDALTIDNARRARITGVFADPDDATTLTLVLFAESRSESPGRWHAQPLATLRRAPSRGEPGPRFPLEFDLGEQWGGVLVAGADLVLGLEPGSDAISTGERLEDWGSKRVDALRVLGSGLDGRVWVWPGASGPESLVIGLPLARGSTDRRIADGLRTIFGGRLVWGRDLSGRATATLALGGDNRPAEPGDRMLSLRFITIAERTTLTVATDAADLDAAVETLADIPQ